MSDNGLTLAAGTPLRAGRYSIEAVIGQGGFGITYRAVDTMLGRLVAIKEFFLAGSSRAGNEVRPPPNLREAFEERQGRIRDEARVLARFRHPNIVTVHEFFEENATIYVVMELLEGRTLGTILKQAHGPIPEADAIGYATAMAAALDAVHAEGLLHRDVKPDNVMVLGGGRAVLVDFGTAREFALGRSSPMSQTLTPGYAPVEQYTARAQFGPATDVYALGATAYHMLTGRFPIPSLDRYSGQEMPAPDEVNPEVSPAVSAAVMEAMALDADSRPATAGTFAAALAAGAAAPQTSGPGAGDETIVVDPADVAAARLAGAGASGVSTDAVAATDEADDGGPRPGLWGSWPVRIAAAVGVAAVAAAVVLIVLLMTDEPAPTGPSGTDWVVGAADPVPIAEVPAGVRTIGSLQPGAVADVRAGVAQVGGVIWVEIGDPGGVGWVPADRVIPPTPEELAALEFLLEDSVLVVALRFPGRWTADRRAPVRAGPTPNTPEVHTYPDGTEGIRITGNTAAVGGRVWAEVLHPAGTGWVRGDRLDLAGQTTFLGEPPGRSCSVLAARGRSFAETYQYWVWQERPTGLDPDGSGVPCAAEYGDDEISDYLRRLE